MMRSVRLTSCLFVLAVAGSACQNEQRPAPTSTPGAVPRPTGAAPTPEIQKVQATAEAIAKAEAELQKNAERARKMRAALTFEDFEATIYREPFEGGKYIVNGDTTIVSRKQLLEFYEDNVQPPQLTRLIVHQVGGLDAKWNQQAKTQLRYCVSSTFGARHADVVQQMANATEEWAKAAAVKYAYVSSEDATCGPANQNVVFDVRPVNLGSYLARAFFPNEPRSARNVLIDESSFELPANEKLQLVGILRHELGHTLGFRHEQTRPESGTCFEDFNWRPLTTYDAFSVMHYPQCNGQGDWSLNLTEKDKHASACLYGAAPGFTIDPTIVKGPCAAAPGPPPNGGHQTESFAAQSVGLHAQKAYGPFSVTAASQLEVVIHGTSASGDPDLYVRFDLQPSVTKYDCRPYLDGPVETCSITVPSNATRVFVMVRGHSAGTYDLRVTYVPAAASGPAARH